MIETAVLDGVPPCGAFLSLCAEVPYLSGSSYAQL
jgi:hypothetical protein